MNKRSVVPNLFNYDINNFLTIVGDYYFYKGKFRKVIGSYIYFTELGVKSCRLWLQGLRNYVDYRELFL